MAARREARGCVGGHWVTAAAAGTDGTGSGCRCEWAQGLQVVAAGRGPAVAHRGCWWWLQAVAGRGDRWLVVAARDHGWLGSALGRRDLR